VNPRELAMGREARSRLGRGLASLIGVEGASRASGSAARATKGADSANS